MAKESRLVSAREGVEHIRTELPEMAELFELMVDEIEVRVGQTESPRQVISAVLVWCAEVGDKPVKLMLTAMSMLLDVRDADRVPMKRESEDVN